MQAFFIFRRENCSFFLSVCIQMYQNYFSKQTQVENATEKHAEGSDELIGCFLYGLLLLSTLHLRLEYIVHLLQKLQEQLGSEKHIILMYDIACQLKSTRVCSICCWLSSISQPFFSGICSKPGLQCYMLMATI